MKNGKKVRALALIASVLALAMGCVYPIVYIKWIVPLYAVCVAVLAAAALLLFLALFTAGGKEKPLRPKY